MLSTTKLSEHRCQAGGINSYTVCHTVQRSIQPNEWQGPHLEVTHKPITRVHSSTIQRQIQNYLERKRRHIKRFATLREKGATSQDLQPANRTDQQIPEET